MKLDLKSLCVGVVVGVLLAVVGFYFYDSYRSSGIVTLDKYKAQIGIIDSLRISLSKQKDITEEFRFKFKRSDSISSFKDSLLNQKFNSNEKADRIRSISTLDDSSRQGYFSEWVSKGDSLQR